MSHQLMFSRLLRYDMRQPGINVPITLKLGNLYADIAAKLDTGCTDCIFERAHGEALELVIESGSLKRFRTATGNFSAYGHMVTLAVEDFEFESLVYFAADDFFDRNVVGQHGFLNHLLVGLDDNAGLMYLNDNADSFANG